MMQRIVYTVLAVFIAGTNAVSGMTVSGAVSGTQTWSMATATDTVRVTSDITVGNGATLIIEPGTIVRGYTAAGAIQKWEIQVSFGGKLQANGTPDEMIKFRNITLDFNSIVNDDDNWVKGCSFYSAWGAPFIDFRNPGNGAVDEESITHLLIEDCYFTNGSYGCIYVTSGGQPTLRNCTFTNTNACGLFVHGGGRTVVENCVFSNLSAAICCASMGATPQWWEPLVMTVDHCTFYNVNKVGANGFTTVSVCNDYGITTVNNPGSLYVFNSVFQDMGQSAIRDWNIEDPNFSENWVITTDYNLFYDITGDPIRLLDIGTHSLEADPLFTDAAAGDFSLRTGSPGIGAADDGLNMGAVQDAPVSAVGNVLSGVPAEAVVTVVTAGSGVAFTVNRPMAGDLVVFDAAGAEAARIALNGRTEAAWNGIAAAGVYYVRLSADPAGTVRKFIRL